jgi:hypothetical protein
MSLKKMKDKMIKQILLGVGSMGGEGIRKG